MFLRTRAHIGPSWDRKRKKELLQAPSSFVFSVIFTLKLLPNHTPVILSVAIYVHVLRHMYARSKCQVYKRVIDRSLAIYHRTDMTAIIRAYRSFRLLSPRHYYSPFGLYTCFCLIVQYSWSGQGGRYSCTPSLLFGVPSQKCPRPYLHNVVKSLSLLA